ncbi:MAG: glucosaminidase domain-containing protein, partial [Bacteroidales bacterium]|nr:glucosaminidase domain-containing protein [Bacteroidales bacterium]
MTLTAIGQTGSTTEALRQDYIQKYTKLAVREMQRSGIPASIIMAQALLESDNGQSDLALTANNHFGIKCHTWTGKRFYYDDDKLDDCFRAYRTVGESFKDHSLFLMNRPRYQFLFDLDEHDYKAWAKGLKEAGYATNPVYAEMLVNIIESNELFRLDRLINKADKRKAQVKLAKDKSELPEFIPKLPIHTRNRIKYVIAGKDDTVEKLTDRFGKLKWEIRKYNEITRRGQVTPGQI